ncbi:MAG: hypothetical protein ABF293_07120 [Flavobacteriaceae bacterium]
MIRFLNFVGLFLFLLSFQGLEAQRTDKEITDEFFKLYAIEPMKAFDYAFATNQWLTRNPDAVDNLKNQYNNLLPLIGNYHGYELIAEKNIGGNLKLASFMVRYDRQPIRLSFVLYRPDDRWQVQNLKYDDRLSNELEESANQNKN